MEFLNLLKDTTAEIQLLYETNFHNLVLKNDRKAMVKAFNDCTNKISIAINRLEAHEKRNNPIFDESENLQLEASLIAAGLTDLNLKTKILHLKELIRTFLKRRTFEKLKNLVDYLSEVFKSLQVVFPYLDMVKELLDILDSVFEMNSEEPDSNQNLVPDQKLLDRLTRTQEDLEVLAKRIKITKYRK